MHRGLPEGGELLQLRAHVVHRRILQRRCVKHYNNAAREFYANTTRKFSEKGADFSGESLLQRQFVLTGAVDMIKVQLAFSSSDMRERSTVLLLLQTDSRYLDI